MRFKCPNESHLVAYLVMDILRFKWAKELHLVAYLVMYILRFKWPKELHLVSYLVMDIIRIKLPKEYDGVCDAAMINYRKLVFKVLTGDVFASVSMY